MPYGKAVLTASGVLIISKGKNLVRKRKNTAPEPPKSARGSTIINYFDAALSRLQLLEDQLRFVRIRESQRDRELQALRDAVTASAPPADDRGNNPARQAIREMELRLGKEGAYEGDLDTELRRGSELAKKRWIRDGLLVGSNDLGLAWSRTRQALEQACDRGELFSLKIANRRWYPAAFMDLPVDDVKAVCQVLNGVDPVAMFVFWHRKHGSLGGRTLSEAFQDGQRQAVLHAAEAFASEHVEDAAAP